MAFFKPKTDIESLKDAGGNGGKYISQSGIYDVTINRAIVSVNAKGARTIDFFINYNGQDQAIYGNLRLDNNDGKENKIGTELFSKLCVICDVDTIEDPTEEDLPIGKAGADKTVDVLSEFNDVEVKMQIQMEYGKYNGNITEKTNIRAFYRADGASAQEIVEGSEVGVSLQKTIDGGYDKATKYDDITAEEVEAWIKAKRPKGTAGASATATKAPSFGKKKFGAN